LTPMATAVGLRCIRCSRAHDLHGLHFGCAYCQPQDPSNLEVLYAEPVDGAGLAESWAHRSPGVWRYSELLPVSTAHAVDMGEGGTPLVGCRSAGEWAGLSDLLVKDESRNPTWSFKDRLASVTVAWAKANGHPGIVASSTGNAGAAAAAYSARAGLPCLILAADSLPAAMKRFMRGLGAMVVTTPDGAGRWALNREVARRWGWLPMSNASDPPVGSHPIAVEACKTIAFEIAEDLDWRSPDAVVLPVGYGDALFGVWRGFEELRNCGLLDHVPRLVAAEAYPSLSRALETRSPGPIDTGGSGSIAFSVATRTSTYQALHAIRASEGLAVAVDHAEIADAHRVLRSREGLLVELSSALPLAAVRRLVAAGVLDADARVVLIATSSGLKDDELSLTFDDAPSVAGDLSSLTAHLRDVYDFAG